MTRTEPKKRRYVKGYGFLSFAKNLANRQVTKKLTDVGKDFGKIAGKKVLTKSAEATGDLIGNKIADKITKVGKPKKSMSESDKPNEIYIPPEKRQQIIDEMRLI